MVQVSVIVPARNAERYIAEALESALAQTAPPSEVIVVDDGSTDRTAEIVSRYAPRVTLVSERVNGSGPARNLAASRSHGDWLAFLDADDVWLPEKLARQLALDLDGVGLVHTDRYNIGHLDGLPAVQGELQPLVDGDVFESLLVGGNALTTSSIMVRRDAFMAVGGFPEAADLIVAQDWDLWVRLAERYRVAACREPLVKYRLHAQGASRQLTRMMRARARVIERGLDLPRGRRLPWATRRRIWAQTHRTNGWDAGRSGHAVAALGAYARSIAAYPLQRAAYIGILRTLAGRG